MPYLYGIQNNQTMKKEKFNQALQIISDNSGSKSKIEIGMNAADGLYTLNIIECNASVLSLIIAKGFSCYMRDGVISVVCLTD